MILSIVTFNQREEREEDLHKLGCSAGALAPSSIGREIIDGRKHAGCCLLLLQHPYIFFDVTLDLLGRKSRNVFLKLSLDQFFYFIIQAPAYQP